MKYSIICLLLLVISSMTIGATPISGDHANFDYFDETSSEWYNLTLSDTYMISSSNPFYDGLNLPIGLMPWDEINQAIDFSNFYDINQSPVSNPHIILHISQGNKENTLYFSNSTIPLENVADYEVVNTFVNLLNLVVGSIHYSYPIWAYGYSLYVMESYPEQYGFEAFVTRGNDLLAVVYESSITLIVADYDFQANYLVDPNGTILYRETKNIDLAYGGQNMQIGFTTFSVGKEYRPNELYFAIIVDNEFSFMIYPDGHAYSGDTNVDIDLFSPIIDMPDNNASQDSNQLDLPFSDPIFIFAIVLLLPITKTYLVKPKK